MISEDSLMKYQSDDLMPMKVYYMRSYGVSVELHNGLLPTEAAGQYSLQWNAVL